jgi:16S rRNA (guanine527-N7)-methyltransferase
MITVPRETRELLDRYAAMLVEENQRQNLVAQSTLDDLGRRHIDDSLQLAPLLGDKGPILDIGSGAGLPGLVLAIVTGRPVTLAEPRRLRCEFLTRVAAELGLSNVTVHQGKAQTVMGAFDAITARAVARLDALIEMSLPLATRDARLVFPKGEGAAEELAQARIRWHGDFRSIPSTTGPGTIIVATGVRRKGKS